MTMSANVSSVAFEGELNSIVREYLQYGGYVLTLRKFEDECSARGKPVAVLGEGINSNQNLLRIQKEMLAHIDSGNRKAFITLWQNNLPPSIRDEDPVAQKLLFYINIYFATYPLRVGQEKSDCDDAMRHFKLYIESIGASLSQTTEFLPFYALPYVPNPRTHPTYRDLFTDSWINDLKTRTDKFLSLAFESSPQPKLFELYTVGGGAENLQSHTVALQQQVYDSEKRVMKYLKQNNKVQADYHNLIGITAELVDALENTVHGKSITPEYLQQICSRLFSSQTKFASQSVDISRPGTAASVLRASVAPVKAASSSEKSRVMELDYDKIKLHLRNGDERDIGYLLQALRWRMTKCPSDQRETIVSTFINNDILGCSQDDVHRENVLNLLTDENEVNRQYTARLFNAMASFNAGRTYLSMNKDLLKALINSLKTEEKDSIGLENVLGCLQKLSLKRSLQTAMIKEDIITWLVELLEDHDSLTDYTLEYSIALLMNLCLRTQGKNQCISSAHKTLKVLSDLLGHENQEILPYVNGTLYSILAVPQIREEAKAMGMEDILQCFIKDDQPDMNRQLNFIIKQLNTTDEPESEQESGDEDDDDDDEEEQDTLEADLDKDELLKPQSNELSGEKLLLTSYVQVPATASGRRKKQFDLDGPLNRPVTPGQMRPESRQSHAKVLQSPLVEDERPPTSTGHRPRTGMGGRPETGESRPRTGTGPKSDTKKDPVRKNSSKPNPDYRAAFGSRPKIPRTPDLGSGGRPTSSGSISEMPPAQYSNSLPRSRPNSAGGSAR